MVTSQNIRNTSPTAITIVTTIIVTLTSSPCYIFYVPTQAEAYNGQVTEGKLYEGEDDADDGDDWFKGPLKFKRHIDDDLRKGSDGRRADDYAVIDPLKQGHEPGRGNDTGRGGGGGGSRGRGGGSSSRGRSWRDDGGSSTRR